MIKILDEAPKKSQPNEGRGFLRAANDPGPKTEKDRDYRGDCTINGVKYWINGWNDTRNPDDPYVSLSFRKAD